MSVYRTIGPLVFLTPWNNYFQLIYLPSKDTLGPRAVSHSENSECRVDCNSPKRRRIASPLSPVVRHPEESGCLEHSPLVSEPHSCLAVEEQHYLLNKLSAEEAEIDKSVISDSDDSQFRKCLFNQIPETDIESQNSCSNCLAEGDFQKCLACKFVRYCSKKCQAEDWPSHKQLCKQGSHGQGKVREKSKKFKVREKSGNFVFGQGSLKFWHKSGKSQGILES